jgi:hypothetical protein
LTREYNAAKTQVEGIGAEREKHLDKTRLSRPHTRKTHRKLPGKKKRKRT